MPVLQQGVSTSVPGASTTVQDILNCASQDIRQVLSGTSSPGQQILIDYTNRISLDLLRFSRWTFLLSPIFKFNTLVGETDYYLGTSPAPVDVNLNGVIDTKLEITNLGIIKRDSVYDRSNSVRLARTDNAPLGQVFGLPAHPKMFRNDVQSGSIVNIYPPPDYGTVWNFSTISRASNVTTFTTTNSTNNDFIVNENNNQVWIQGVADTSYNGYWPIISVTGNTVTVWNPGSNSSSTSGTATSGYTIEFRYFFPRIQLTSPSQIIQIPDDYVDIVCAGVNWLAFQYLQKPEDAQAWQQLYMQGRTQMVKDKNLFPRAEEFVRPDSLAIIQQTTTGVGLDSGLETSIP